uniref:26S proteasome non-ATPase regulatory subunit 2 n=1 Tax=Timema tahoe TaxID=61484 RepID=A0A7R9IM98_9NEOP|nr:unnamed protein product [Timema tahoe]
MYRGELVTDGFENMDCGAVQAVERWPGRQDAVEAIIAALEVIPEPFKSMSTTLIDVCAYAGTGDVLKIQQLLHICSEHYEVSEKEDKKDDKKEKKEEKKDEKDLSSRQGVAVLGIALICMGEEIGSEMAFRTFGHLVQDRATEEKGRGGHLGYSGKIMRMKVLFWNHRNCSIVFRNEGASSTSSAPKFFLSLCSLACQYQQLRLSIEFNMCPGGCGQPRSLLVFPFDAAGSTVGQGYVLLYQESNPRVPIMLPYRRYIRLNPEKKGRTHLGLDDPKLAIQQVTRHTHMQTHTQYETSGSRFELRYCEPVIRRSVPLALGLISVSNPRLNILDTLSKFSHDSDAEVAHNSIFAMGLVGAGTNNARLGAMLRQLAQFHGKDPNNLFMVRIAQGLTHLGKGTLTLCPYHSDRQLLSPVALAGLLATLIGFLDVKNSKSHEVHVILSVIERQLFRYGCALGAN